MSRKTPEPKPCVCADFEIGRDTGTDNNPDVTIETTGCTATTARTFAIGHDAKLKALLIRAGVEGLDVRFGRASGVVTTTDPVTAASQFQFAGLVKEGIERGQARAKAKADRAAAKATEQQPEAPPAEPQQQPKPRRGRRTAAAQ